MHTKPCCKVVSGSVVGGLECFSFHCKKCCLNSWWKTLILGIMSVAFCYWFDLSGEDLEYWCGFLWMISHQLKSVMRGRDGEDKSRKESEHSTWCVCMCVCGIAIVKPISLYNEYALEVYLREHGEGRRRGSVGNTVTQCHLLMSSLPCFFPSSPHPSYFPT